MTRLMTRHVILCESIEDLLLVFQVHRLLNGGNGEAGDDEDDKDGGDDEDEWLLPTAKCQRNHVVNPR